MNDFKFELGSLVKDEITGFEGICYDRTQWFHNCNTYGVKPLDLINGKPQESETFDEPQLFIIGKSPKLYKSNDFKFELGEEVEEIVTGFKGIILARTNWLNGCNNYGVKSRNLKDGIPIVMQFFNEGHLKSTEDSKKLIPTKNNDSGGPVTKVKRFTC